MRRMDDGEWAKQTKYPSTLVHNTPSNENEKGPLNNSIL